MRGSCPDADGRRRRYALGTAVTRVVSSVAGVVLLLLIRGYQVALRPLLIGSCKFMPTCSDYFAEAVRRYGPWRGGWLGVRRVLRCHPFGPGGIDPVPEPGESSRTDDAPRGD